MREIADGELALRAASVIKDYDGILPYCEAFYVESILYSAGRALEAFERFEKILHTGDPDPAYLISLVQEAVGHTAALSRFFWPSGLSCKGPKEIRQLRETRGKRLRESFGLGDESPLRGRSLRDAWEHFDERLDAYLLAKDSGFFFPSPMIGSHILADDPQANVFKLLDSETGCLVLMGKKYFYNTIKNEVLRIFQKAKLADQNGGRLKQSGDISIREHHT